VRCFRMPHRLWRYWPFFRPAVRMESAICEVGLEPAIVLVEDSASLVQLCLARSPFFISD
jgi:hypothetical protein